MVNKPRVRTITAVVITLFALQIFLVTVFHRSGQDELPSYKRPATIDRIEPSDVSEPFTVEVWGKAAVGNYFWEYLLEAGAEKREGGMIKVGEYFSEEYNTKLLYQTGYLVMPERVSPGVKNVVLVLNAHNEEKRKTAQVWMDKLYGLPKLENVGIILHGMESCDNSWVKPYLSDPHLKIKFVFLIYGDASLIDNERIFHWPLGVATYRKFPIHPETVQSDFTNLCDFQATIYPNSSRAELMKIINEDPMMLYFCDVKARYSWEPNESKASMEDYTRRLSRAMYTLSPVGENAECYRWYEAVAVGSVPIMEDKIHPSSCGMDPLDLMRSEDAPFIYLKRWSEIPQLLHRLEEAREQDPSKGERQRKKVMEWYTRFRQSMVKRFFRVLRHTFVHPSDNRSQK